jgi:hypothetical protein
MYMHVASKHMIMVILIILDTSTLDNVRDCKIIMRTKAQHGSNSRDQIIKALAMIRDNDDDDNKAPRLTCYLATQGNDFAHLRFQIIEGFSSSSSWQQQHHCLMPSINFV